jgi:hypothetical protein
MSTNVATPVGRGLIFVAVAAVAWGSGGIVVVLAYPHRHRSAGRRLPVAPTDGAAR